MRLMIVRCRYAKEWEVTITRLGRWIDFENDYKTLDPSFMESVWWVFGQLWEKDLVYRGFKVRCLLPSLQATKTKKRGVGKYNVQTQSCHCTQMFRIMSKSAYSVGTLSLYHSSCLAPCQ